MAAIPLHADRESAISHSNLECSVRGRKDRRGVRQRERWTGASSGPVTLRAPNTPSVDLIGFVDSHGFGPSVADVQRKFSQRVKRAIARISSV